MAREIADELETASLELDLLIGEMRLSSNRVSTFELVEERVSAIANRLIVAVRGPEAAIRTVA